MGSPSRSGGQANPAVRSRYIEWMKIPKETRASLPNIPQTKEEFAQKWNVNRATLWRWEKDPNFKRELADEALGLVTPDELVRMIDVQKQAAMSGDIKAFEVLIKHFRLTEVLAPKPDDDEDEKFMEKLSDEELEALIPDGWAD